MASLAANLSSCQHTPRAKEPEYVPARQVLRDGTGLLAGLGRRPESLKKVCTLRKSQDPVQKAIQHLDCVGLVRAREYLSDTRNAADVGADTQSVRKGA
jgi:hypothetical protein